MSETQKDRIRAHMIEYKGVKDKHLALNEMSMSMFGDKRWTTNQTTTTIIDAPMSRRTTTRKHFIEPHQLCQTFVSMSSTLSA